MLRDLSMVKNSVEGGYRFAPMEFYVSNHSTPAVQEICRGAAKALLGLIKLLLDNTLWCL
jgi:hypothetical protein